jgi:hypothetical protein
MTNGSERVVGQGFPWRIIGWGLAALLLLLPLVAMQFTAEVNWGPEDFIFAAIIFGAVGGAFELAVRASRSLAYRGAVACALAAAFVIVWANAAVGMIGDEDNAYNLFFLAIIPLALAGGAVARFRAGGLALVCAVAAAAQIAVALVGSPQDPRGAIFSAGFALLWLLAALLFRKAAQEGRG